MLLHGFIKLHRQICEWEWYKEPVVSRVFIHLLLNANFESKRWQGIEVKRGQFICSLQHLASQLGISVQNVRTALEKLEKSGEILKVSTQSQTVITICKYESYQGLNDSDQHTANTPSTHHQHTINTLPTYDQHTANTQLTNNQQQRKNDNNNKNDNNEKNKDTPMSEISILKSEPMWVQEIETFPMYQNLQSDLKTAFRFYLDDQQEKEKRGITSMMVKANLIKIQSLLAKWDPAKIAKSLYSAVEKSNKDFNPAWIAEAEKKENEKTDNPTRATDWKFGQQIYTGK